MKPLLFIFFLPLLTLIAQTEKDTVLIQSKTLEKTIITFDTLKQIRREPLTFKKENKKTPRHTLNITGWKSFEINGGKTNESSFGQGLFLSIKGEINRDYYLTGEIKDHKYNENEISEGVKLRNLDQVFIKLTGPDLEFSMGDIFFNHDKAYLPDKEKVQGLFLSYKGNKIGVGRKKGSIGSCFFNGYEGVQGPYYIKNEKGESHFLIIPGTVRLYHNGSLLTQGEDDDYYIDYLSGTIYFTDKNSISESDRFYIEYEYTNLAYEQLTAFSGISYQKLKVTAYTTMQLKNQPVLYSLSKTEENYIKDLKPEEENIVLSGIDTVEQGEGRYMDKEGHFQYVGLDSTGNYNLNFYYAGQGQGDYVYQGNGVYHYTGEKQGSYLIGKEIIPPNRQDYYEMEMKDTQYTLQTVISSSQPNTFHDYKRNGYLIKGKTKIVNPRLYYELLIRNKDFKALKTVLPPEHNRNYLYSNTKKPEDFQWHKTGYKDETKEIQLSYFLLDKKNKRVSLYHQGDYDFLKLLFQSVQRSTFDPDNTKRQYHFHSFTFKKDSVSKTSFSIEQKTNRLALSDSAFCFIEGEEEINSVIGKTKFNYRNETYKEMTDLDRKSYGVQNQYESTNPKKHHAFIDIYYKKIVRNQGNEDFFRFKYGFHYFNKQNPIKVNIENSYSLEQSLKYSRNFKSVAKGTGNYRFDSLASEYVPDDYGDYILIRELMKDSQPVTRLKHQSGIDFHPGKLKKALSPFIVKFNSGNEIKTNNRPNMKKASFFPFGNFQNLFYKNTVIRSELQINTQSWTGKNWNLSLISSYRKMDNRQYVNFSQFKQTRSLSMISQCPIRVGWSLDNELKWNKTENRYSGLMDLNYNSYTLSTGLNWNSGNALSFQTEIKAGRHLTTESTIREYVIRKQVVFPLFSFAILSFSLDWTRLDSGKEKIHTLFSQGRKKGDNWELKVETNKKLNRNNQINLLYYLRKYAHEKMDPFIHLNWKIYF